MPEYLNPFLIFGFGFLIHTLSETLTADVPAKVARSQTTLIYIYTARSTQAHGTFEYWYDSMVFAKIIGIIMVVSVQDTSRYLVHTNAIRILYNGIIHYTKMVGGHSHRPQQEKSQIFFLHNS